MSITFIVIKLKLCSINFLTYQNIFALDLDRQSQPFSLRFLFIFYFIRLFCLFLMIKRFFYFSSFYLRASTNIQLLNCVVVCIRLINFWLYTFIIKYCVECTYVGISKKIKKIANIAYKFWQIWYDEWFSLFNIFFSINIYF